MPHFQAIVAVKICGNFSALNLELGCIGAPRHLSPCAIELIRVFLSPLPEIEDIHREGVGYSGTRRQVRNDPETRRGLAIPKPSAPTFRRVRGLLSATYSPRRIWHPLCPLAA